MFPDADSPAARSDYVKFFTQTRRLGYDNILTEKNFTTARAGRVSPRERQAEGGWAIGMLDKTMGAPIVSGLSPLALR